MFFASTGQVEDFDGYRGEAARERTRPFGGGEGRDPKSCEKYGWPEITRYNCLQTYPDCRYGLGAHTQHVD